MKRFCESRVPNPESRRFSESRLLILVQNDPDVPPGVYENYVMEQGVPFAVVSPFAGEVLPPVDEVSAVIVLGGAMGVHEIDKYPFLSQVRQFMEETVEAEVPLLGICLGGQLLADIQGGRVTSNSCGEKGTLAVSLTEEGAADPLFSDVEREFITFQWHNDSFDIPSGATKLAFSAACPNQAFRYGTNAYGVQFHPEVNRDIVDLWVRSSRISASGADSFVEDFNRFSDVYAAASRRILLNFLRIVD